MRESAMGAEYLKPRFVATVTAKGTYPDGKGLYLQVGDGGEAKSWLFRFVSPVTGKERQMGLGPLHTIGLAEARERARLCRVQLLDRIDPIKARKEAREKQELEREKEKTFRHCAEGWMAAEEIGWSPQYIRNVTREFAKHIYPQLANLPVQMVDVDLLHRVLEPIHRVHPTTYANAQMYIEGVLNWAKAKGYVSGDNPASLKGPLGHLLKPIKKFHIVKHHESMPWQRIGAFVHLLRTHKSEADHHCRLCTICHSPQREEIEAARREGVALSRIAARLGVSSSTAWQTLTRHERWRAAGGTNQPVRPISSYALDFLILTAVRKGQAVEARWEHIDLEDRIWICPPEGHKTGKKTGEAHIVPLSDQAMAIITEMKELQKASGQNSEFVFVGQSRTGHVSESKINSLMKQDLKRTDCVPHGFRTTFACWSVEHDYSERDSEMALAHTVGSTVRNIYKRFAQRIEPRRLMMQDWADECDRTEPLDAKIIPMRRAKNGEPA
jgi:integrase